MKKLFIIIIFTFLEFSCSNEYIDFHTQKTEYQNQNIKIQTQNQNFSSNQVENRDLEIFTTPDKKVLENIVNYINNAKKRVYLEVYIFTEKRIMQALKDSKAKGIDVQVILEKNVYGSTNINKKSFEELKKAGISVAYASEENFTFTHSKFFIIDDFYLLGTGNMSYSTFTKNKEFFIKGENKQDLAILEQIFSKDFLGIRYGECNANLVISPECSRNKLEATLKEANESIYIYAQSIDDSQIQEILFNKKKQGKDVKVILGDETVVKTNQKLIEKLKNNNISFKSPKKPYVHAKVFIVDNKYVYIGSINFTKTSMDKNREIGIIFVNNEAVNKITKLFLNNFNSL